MVPPIVLDIDGTMTIAGATRAPAPVDPRLFGRLREWSAPVILATGKAFPFPIALCQFIGIPPRVVAETGGIVCTGDRLEALIDTDGPEGVVADMRERSGDPGGTHDLINRWRETEAAFVRQVSLDDLTDVAADYGLEVVDTGYAFHVKDPDVSKGKGLDRLLAWESLTVEDCVAIGDSPNDTSMFARVGRAFAVANAAPEARAAADEVLDRGHADGTLDVLDRLEREAMEDG